MNIFPLFLFMGEYTQIGRMVASFGLKGEVILQHKLTDTLVDKAPACLFIEINNGSYIPYFITEMRPKSADCVVVSLEDINTREAAHALLKKKVFLQDKTFRQLVSPDSELYLLQFVIEDEKEGRLGKIAEVMSLPQQQTVAKVWRNDDELLIPLSEETIQKVDRQQKIIYVSLPEGLLAIYEE